MNKKFIGLICMILIVILPIVSSIEYVEEEDGSIYEFVKGIFRTDTLGINEVVVFNPTPEPSNPEFGMLYLDKSTSQLRFYNGESWISLTPTEEQCIPEWQCSEWGDCINGYKTRVCSNTKSLCGDPTKVEKEQCDSNTFKLPGPAGSQNRDSQSEQEDRPSNSQESGANEDSQNIEIESEITVEEEVSETKSEESESVSAQPTQGDDESDVEEIIEEVESEIQDSGEEVIGERSAEESVSDQESNSIEESSESSETSSIESNPDTESSSESESSSDSDNSESSTDSSDSSSDDSGNDGGGDSDSSGDSGGDIPEQLFDITFELEETILSNSQELIAVVTLQNFGTEYVPARLIYVFRDENQNVVYETLEETRVYTDQASVKEFKNLNLESGIYTLELSVEYAGIVEEFEQPFEINRNMLKTIRSFFANLFGG